MAEYIERDAIYTAFANACTDVLERASELYYVAGFSYEHVIEILDDIPIADVAPVAYGQWIDKPTGRYGQMQSWCSACGKHSGIGGIKSNRHKPYCPYCGAKMKEGEIDA